MGKILDYIVKKGEGNYLCYKTNKVSLAHPINQGD